MPPWQHPTTESDTNVMSPAGSTARTDTRARIETLPEIASPISISASLSAGPVVITRACDYVMIAIEWCGVETGSEHLTLSRPSPVPIGRTGCTAAPSKARASCHASKPSPSYHRKNAKQSQDNPIRQRALWGSTSPLEGGGGPAPRGWPPPPTMDRRVPSL